MITIADPIAYRRKKEKLIGRVADVAFADKVGAIPGCCLREQT